MQWDGTNTGDIIRFVGGPMSQERSMNGCLIIHTAEGNMKASRGDWIIEGVKGEFYPCKPDIFKATYDKVEE